jgi:hypothetical protein
MLGKTLETVWYVRGMRGGGDGWYKHSDKKLEQNSLYTQSRFPTPGTFVKHLSLVHTVTSWKRCTCKILATCPVFHRLPVNVTKAKGIARVCLRIKSKVGVAFPWLVYTWQAAIKVPSLSETCDKVPRRSTDKYYTALQHLHSLLAKWAKREISIPCRSNILVYWFWHNLLFAYISFEHTLT